MWLGDVRSVLEHIYMADGICEKIWYFGFWPSALHQGFGSIPTHQTQTSFFLPWHLWMCSLFSSFYPLRNVSIKLSTLFTPEFKMLSLGMNSLVFQEKLVWNELLRLSRSSGKTLNHAPMIRCSFSHRQGIITWSFIRCRVTQNCEVVHQYSCITSSFWPLLCIITQLRDATERTKKRLNFRRSKLWLKFTQIFQQRHWKLDGLSFSCICWASGATPQEPQTSTNSYLNRCQTGPRLQAPLDK